MDTIFQQAEDIIKAHLAECADEIVEWKRTGILRAGYVREIEAMMARLDENHATQMAESLVVGVALKELAKDAK